MLERKFARIGIEVRKNASVSDYAAARDGIKVNFSDGFSGTFRKNPGRGRPATAD